jgi:hypothetical protein
MVPEDRAGSGWLLRLDGTEAGSAQRIEKPRKKPSQAKKTTSTQGRVGQGAGVRGLPGETNPGLCCIIFPHHRPQLACRQVHCIGASPPFTHNTASLVYLFVTVAGPVPVSNRRNRLPLALAHQARRRCHGKMMLPSVSLSPGTLSDPA